MRQFDGPAKGLTTTLGRNLRPPHRKVESPFINWTTATIGSASLSGGNASRSTLCFERRFTYRRRSLQRKLRRRHLNFKLCRGDRNAACSTQHHNHALRNTDSVDVLARLRKLTSIIHSFEWPTPLTR